MVHCKMVSHLCDYISTSVNDSVQWFVTAGLRQSGWLYNYIYSTILGIVLVNISVQEKLQRGLLCLHNLTARTIDFIAFVSP